MTRTPPIVVGLDGSDRDADALALARRLARTLGTGILAAHVFPGPETPPPPPDDDPARVAALAMLQEACRELGGVAAWEAAVPGHDVPRALKRLAADEAAPVLVVAASHHGVLGRIAPGSVPERLLHDAPCAVAVAPKDYAARDLRPHTVGVAWHADATAAPAARVATALAARLGATLELVSVLETDVTAAGLAMYQPVAVPEAMATQRRHLQEELERAAETIGFRGPVLTRILDGARVRELALETEHLSLLVTGTHGRGPAAELLAGGVSGPLTRHSHCPLLVVPEAAEAQLLEALTPAPAAA